MKKIASFLIIAAFSLQATAQTVEIRSIELDRMIWNGINEYRKSFGHQPVDEFDTDSLRRVSARVTDRNLNAEVFAHTTGEARFKGYDTECIYSLAKSTSSKPNGPSIYDTVLTQEEMQMLANECVQAWIKSNDHNYLIRCKFVDYSTVTSVVRLTGTSMEFVVSYHDIGDWPGNPKNKYQKKQK